MDSQECLCLPLLTPHIKTGESIVGRGHANIEFLITRETCDISSIGISTPFHHQQIPTHDDRSLQGSNHPSHGVQRL